MKRLQIFKHASDTAFASVPTANPAQVDIEAAQAFQKSGFDQLDYPYWKSSFEQSRRQFIALSSQPSASEQAAARQARVEKTEAE
jgi:hypothetical protein